MGSASELIFQFSLQKKGTGAKDAEKEIASLEVQVGSLAESAMALAGPAAIGAVVAGLKYSVDRAMEAEQAMAQTQAVIAATGGAAGLSAGQIGDLADSLAGMTGVDDETIQGGENLLLTFKEIKGQTFERATSSMLDMAVAMNQGKLEGIDLKSTALQMGKALNVAAGDTAGATAALSALHKQGVSFTAEQKEAARVAIEAGDTAKYQAIVMSELEHEFGGAAKAAGDTAEGGMAKLKIKLDDIAESVGDKILPPWEKFIGYLNDTIDLAAKDSSNIDMVNQALAMGVITQGEAVEALDRVHAAAGTQTIDLDEVRQRLEAEVAARQAQVVALTNWRDESDAATAASANWKNQLDLNQVSEAAEATSLAGLKGGLGELNALINGQLGPTTEQFKQQQSELVGKSDELRGKIAELEAKHWLSPEQKQELAETRAQLVENDTAIETNAAKHDEATRRILFNMLQQRIQSAITAGQISGEDADKVLAAANQQAVSWGLIDQATADAANNINTNVSNLIHGGTVDEFITAMGPGTDAVATTNQEALNKIGMGYTTLSSTVSTNFKPVMDSTITQLKSNVPAAAQATMDKLKEQDDLIKKLNAPDGNVAKFLIGLSQIEAAYKRIKTAAEGAPGWPGSGSASGGSQQTGSGQPYADGGIAVGPASGFPATLHGIEAVVPLPDGRTIPVQMMGGGSGTVINLIVQEGPFSMTDKVRMETEIIPMLRSALGI